MHRAKIVICRQKKSSNNIVILAFFIRTNNNNDNNSNNNNNNIISFHNNIFIRTRKISFIKLNNSSVIHITESESRRGAGKFYLPHFPYST